MPSYNVYDVYDVYDDERKTESKGDLFAIFKIFFESSDAHPAI